MIDKDFAKFCNIPEVQKVGIYAIHNKRNGKYYIGSSTNVYKRLKKHNLNGTNKQLIIDRYKYPSKAWECIILKTFPDGTITEKELIEKENDYIKKYDSINKGYNRMEAYCHGREMGFLVCKIENIPQQKEAVSVTLPKGTKERIKAAGFSSVNGYINDLIKKDLEEREKAEKC